MKSYIFRLLKGAMFVGMILLFRGESSDLDVAKRAEHVPVGFANPAAVYCMDLGYDYEVQHLEGGDAGVCKFRNSQTCDAWDFLTGKCGAEFSACARAQNGYQLQVKSDGNDPFSTDYAVCVSADGREVASVVTMTDLVEKATKTGCGNKDRPEVTVEPETEPAEPLAAPLTLPASFDWRSRPKGNYLTAVKDQGGCGSCWAFSAVGTTEAALNIANDTVGNNYNLSEQYLVSDCHTSAWDYETCCGGWQDIALTYIKTNGIPDEACMPYVDGAGCSCNGGTCDTNCTYSTDFTACSDRRCSDRCSNWSTRLKKISTTGPVSTARATIKTQLISKGPLAVSLRMGGSFVGGVYTCSVDSPANHAVVIVGFNDAGQYWIVKNSWGAAWNGNGYFNVGYGECSIEQDVYYAKAAASTVPTPKSPTGTITDRTPTYKWSPIIGATKYNVQLYRGTTLVYSKVYNSTACSGSVCQGTPTTTLMYAAHKWRVRAYQGGAWKPFSAYKNFTVQKAASGFNSQFNGSAAGWTEQSGNWVIGSTNYSSAGVPGYWASASHSGSYSKLTYEARMKRTGSYSGSANALYIRGDPTPLDSSKDWNTALAFQWTNNGYFAVYKGINGSWTALQGWTATTAINNGGWNTIKVTANGSALKFYINGGAPVWEGSSAAPASGLVGLVLYRDSTSTGNKLYVDWAKLSTTVVADVSDELEPVLGIEVPGGDRFQSP